MQTQEKTKLTDRVIDHLKKTLVEMEELRVQVALGKAEAKDLYENASLKFKNHLHEAQQRFAGINSKASHEIQTMKVLFESL